MHSARHSSTCKLTSLASLTAPDDSRMNEKSNKLFSTLSSHFQNSSGRLFAKKNVIFLAKKTMTTEHNFLSHCLRFQFVTHSKFLLAQTGGGLYLMNINTAVFSFRLIQRATNLQRYTQFEGAGQIESNFLVINFVKIAPRLLLASKTSLT